MSSYREMLLEHLFSGELMRHGWLSKRKRIEVLKPQVDDGGYDLVLEANSVVRHVQLKATFRGSKVRRFPINVGLSQKPSGCVIILLFNNDTLALGPFLWFGGLPSKPLPDMDSFPVGKHTKGNAQGVKLDRPRIRTVPWAAFESVPTIDGLALKLFGSEAVIRK
jgi:hypothetical protein